MKKELIAELFEKFERASHVINGIECWSARELQEILGYSKWSNFLKVVDKGKAACENAGEAISDHFADTEVTSTVKPFYSSYPAVKTPPLRGFGTSYAFIARCFINHFLKAC